MRGIRIYYRGGSALAKSSKGRNVKKSPSKNRTGHPGRTKPSNSLEQLDSAEVRKRLEGFAPRWADWYKETEGGDSFAAAACLEAVGVVLSLRARLTGWHTVTAYTAVELEKCIKVLPKVVARDDVEMVIDGTLIYTKFLADTGAWTGSTADHDAAVGFLQGLLSPGKYETGIPSSTQDEELAGLEATNVIGYVHDLVRWAGAGVPATATGAVRMRDITAAAACVGVSARPKEKGETSDFSHLLSGAEPDAYVVHSMREVPILGLLWPAMIGAGILEAKSTKVVPGPGSAVLAGEDGAAKLRVYRRTIDLFLQAWRAAQSERLVVGPKLAEGYLDLFVSALSGRPWENRMRPAQADSEPTGFQVFGGLVAMVMMRELPVLHKLGLLEVDAHLWIRPELRRSYADAVAQEAGLELGHPQEAW